MDAKELLREGKLGDAIDAQVQVVKGVPDDTGARIFLFELLATAGDWEHAGTHLDVVAHQAPDMAAGVSSYQGVLRAEQAREALFVHGRGAPQSMTKRPFDPEPYLSALLRLRAGDRVEAKRLIDRAEVAHVPRAGTLDGVPFGDLRDADDVLACHLEVMTDGVYGWIPFAQIAGLEFAEPRFPRDLLWRSVSITLTDGGTSTMFTPVRYPASTIAADDQLRMGRISMWRDEGDVAVGVGQRGFLVDDGVVYVLDVRKLSFDAS